MQKSQKRAKPSINHFLDDVDFEFLCKQRKIEKMAFENLKSLDELMQKAVSESLKTVEIESRIICRIHEMDTYLSELDEMINVKL